MTCIVGFTGTQQGMTAKQRAAVLELLRSLQAEKGAKELHHGVCIGADFQCHQLAKTLDYMIVGHPGITQNGKVYNRASVTCDITQPEKQFLDRNKDIVETCSLLIATPKAVIEELRSGTWSTVRYARKLQKPIVIVYPDGRSVGAFGDKITATK